MISKSERLFTALVTAFLIITAIFVIIVINDLSKDDDGSGLAAVQAADGSGGALDPGVGTGQAPAAQPVTSGTVAPGAVDSGTGAAAGPSTAGGTTSVAPEASGNNGASGGKPGSKNGGGAKGSSTAIVESTVPVPAAENAQGVSAGEIKLGGTSITNSVLAWPTATTLPVAYFQKVNETGGVNGRKINYITYDADITDTNRVLANIRRLNEQDKVLALTGGGHPFADGSYPYLAQHGIPVIGTMSEIAQMYKSPFAFPTGTYVAQGCRAAADYVARTLKPAKVATFHGSPYISEDCAKGMIAAFKSHGIPNVFTSKTPIGQPDYTQDIVRARQAGAEFLNLAFDCASATRIAQAAQRQNWRPKHGFGGTSFAYCQSMPKILGDFANGSVWEFSGHLWTSSNPGARELVKLGQAVNPNIEFEGGGLPAWTGAHLMVDALKAVGTDVTRSRVMGWIAAQKAWQVDGQYTVPMDFTRRGPGPWTRVPLNQTMIGTVENGDIREKGFVPDPAGGDPSPDRTYKP